MRPALDDGDVRVFVGDAREVLRSLPERSVHCVVTSPPYLGLREYGEDDREVGREASPGEFAAALVEVFRGVRRVLRDDGVAFLNPGDSYAANRSYQVSDSMHVDVGNSRGSRVPDGLKPKDLIGVPWIVAFALQADGWWLRSEIVWAKPNPMPESVRDRPSQAHEKVFMLAKRDAYFYDGVAVEEPSVLGAVVDDDEAPGVWRNARNVLEFSPASFPGAHFAVMPSALAEWCVRAGSSEGGACPECGAPFERAVVRESLERHELPRSDPRFRPKRYDSGKNGEGVFAGRGQRYASRRLVGWRPTCAHDVVEGDAVPCVVLDPFAGAGTTLLAARSLGRHSIGVELYERFVRDVLGPRLAQQSLLT